MKVKNFLLKQSQSLDLRRKLVSLDLCRVIPLIENDLVLGHVKCDLLEPFNEGLNENPGGFVGGIVRVELAQLEHHLKDVGRVLMHGKHVSASLELVEELSRHEERAHQVDDAAGGHESREPERQIDFGTFGDGTRSGGLFVLVRCECQKAEVVLGFLENGGN